MMLYRNTVDLSLNHKSSDETYLSVGETVQHSNHKALKHTQDGSAGIMNSLSAVGDLSGATWNELRVRLMKFLA